MRSWVAILLQAMTDFNDALSAAHLMDSGYIGSFYTWSNNMEGSNCIRARLDRCLINSRWLVRFPHTTVQHLSRTLSDHAPLHLSWREQLTQEPRPFIFQCGPCTQIFTQWWRMIGRSLSLQALCLVGKLKRLKRVLKDWNKSTATSFIMLLMRRMVFF